ncbi:acyl-ACP--UDP-N-acetylglucosamine O-acyltransferase [Phycisphaerales bacterium AB-hyl4]|uniref:Acyl-ACP--UDP-N-acetylglucosamine O-acyltransferase n=1 Tax=Natronomicrosphaera hydrolytica TaxID=3242702 RepID=A0ABV4UBE0_9BACT
MPDIHPTAHVDPQAQLADDVVVGPGCVLNGDVRLGAGTRLVAGVYIQGPFIAGERNIIYPGACLGYPGQDLKYNPDHPGAGVRLGDDNIIREHVTIHRATNDDHPTTIGNHAFFMVHAHVGHDCRVDDHVMIVNGSMLGGHVEVHDHAIISGNVGVHQFSRIGRLTMIAGNTGISHDIPPFCTVSHRKRVGGLNIVGLRRAGLREHVAPLREAFRIFYRQGHTKPVAIEKIEMTIADDPLVREFADFIKASKRGITPYGYWRKDDPELQ